MTLRTWGGRSEFRYEGSVAQGTWISWKDKAKAQGWSKPWLVKADEYRQLPSNFSGQEVTLGNYRNPQRGSVEEWLKEKYDQWGLTSYIGAILVNEGYAERCARPGLIRFLSNQPCSGAPRTDRPQRRRNRRSDAQPNDTMSQKELEALLGVSAMTIYLWRRQETDPLPFRSVPTGRGRNRNYFVAQEVRDWLSRNRPKLMPKFEEKARAGGECEIPFRPPEDGKTNQVAESQTKRHGLFEWLRSILS